MKWCESVPKLIVPRQCPGWAWNYLRKCYQNAVSTLSAPDFRQEWELSRNISRAALGHQQNPGVREGEVLLVPSALPSHSAPLSCTIHWALLPLSSQGSGFQSQWFLIDIALSPRSPLTLSMWHLQELNRSTVSSANGIGSRQLPGTMETLPCVKCWILTARNPPPPCWMGEEQGWGRKQEAQWEPLYGASI